MKNCTERDNYVFSLWDNGYTYSQIASMDLPSFLSLSRIRVIVYGGPDRLKNDFERKVYDAFRLKFLELQDVHLSIMYVYENQPTSRLFERSIRDIINRKLSELKTNTCKSK